MYVEVIIYIQNSVALYTQINNGKKINLKTLEITVRGSQKYYEDLKVEMTEEFKKRTEGLLNNSDSIKTFIERKIKITKNQKDVKNHS